jgi:hypothetical protein
MKAVEGVKRAFARRLFRGAGPRRLRTVVENLEKVAESASGAYHPGRGCNKRRTRLNPARDSGSRRIGWQPISGGEIQ